MPGRDDDWSAKSPQNRRSVEAYRRVIAVNARSDEELLAEHLAGKPGAFDLLVGRYLDEVFAFVYRFVNNAANADDLVQDTFLQVHLAAATFDRSRAFKPWLYTIAANKARDFLRSKARRSPLSIDAASKADDGQGPAELIASGAEPLDQQVETSETNRAVREVVASMPEHLRLILMLGYFQQLPYAEIAEILEIPVGTVKSRLHAAVAHFAKLWRARTGGDPVSK